MRFVLAAVLVVHGVAHTVGFVVPWRLLSTPEVPYRTTILAGAVDVGAAGARAVGLAWLAAAVGFVILGGAVFAGWGVRGSSYVLLGASIALCAAGWPEARIGLAVNVALLLVLLLMPALFSPAP